MANAAALDYAEVQHPLTASLSASSRFAITDAAQEEL